MVVLVTGANGQLGQSLQFVAKKYPQIDFVFCDSTQLDIVNLEQVKHVFEQIKPNFCINTAAYTTVDKAESESEKAALINVTGVKNLAEICKENDVVLLHISTDFVFDGNKKSPYTERDIPNPTGVYGQTKLESENILRTIWNKHFIIRTSWVYSQFGHNFMKTMLRLASVKESISVVNDQIGTPTNAIDLAETLVQIILQNHQQPNQNLFGIYHFSNEGACSWYEFAKEIFKQKQVQITLNAITTAEFPTPAKRPAYSVLDKTKLKETFGIQISDWKSSLEKELRRVI